MKPIGKHMPAVLAALLLFSLTACDRAPAFSDPESRVVSAEASKADNPVPDAESAEATPSAETASPSHSGNTTAAAKKSTAATTQKTGVSTKPSAAGRITFADLDLSDPDALTDAPGADSGANGTLYVFNTEKMRERLPSRERYYDAIKFMVSLQGLENRNGVSVYMKDHTSDTWLTFFRAQQDGLLYGKKIVTLNSLDAVLDKLGNRIKAHGIVVWDPAQPFTSNIATTVCGVEGYLPVMYSEDEDSLYVQLTEEYGNSVVKMDLRGKFTGKKGAVIWDTAVASTGSAKCDAYLWAIEKYVKTDKTSRAYIAYMTDYYPLSENGGGQFLDNSVYETYLPDQDFVVAKKIFTFDLSVWSDEPATDDPAQPAGLDYQTLCKLLRYQYDRNDGDISQCIGFPPFPYKYTARVGGRHGDVATEWETVEVMTAYNIAVQADCPGPSSLYNASVFCQYKQQMTYTQAAKRKAALSPLPPLEDNTYYLCMYMGDFDAASWTYHIGTRFWKDPARGKVPAAWGFNPNLMDRVPMLWDYFYATATENDVFVGGDSGAGYVNPTLLEAGKRQHSDLPDGLAAWTKWCTKWYKKADLTITGMLLNGNSHYPGNRVLEAFATFSGDGIAVCVDTVNKSELIGGTAVNTMLSAVPISGKPEQSATALINLINRKRELPFYSVRCCVTSPTLLYDTVILAQQKLNAEGQGRKIKVLDPYTFFAMILREKSK